MDELRVNQRIAFSELRTTELASRAGRPALAVAHAEVRLRIGRDCSRRCSTFLLALDAKTFSCQRTRGGTPRQRCGCFVSTETGNAARTNLVNGSGGFDSRYRWELCRSSRSNYPQNFRGADRDRTDDLRLAKPALSQLSYSPDNRGGPGQS